MAEQETRMQGKGVALSKDAKWLIGILLVIAMPVIGFQWKQSVQVSSAMSSFSEIKRSLDRLTNTVAELMQDDITDLKSRVAVLEGKQILPRTESELQRINERLRELERNR